jgi:hypothetical protein
LDAAAYANYVAVLTAPHDKKAYEFLKLVLEGARIIKSEQKKGLEMALRIHTYLKQEFKLSNI